jgi:uncharacterized peroxidase-related enzyme
MNRIPPVTAPSPEQQALFDAIHAQLGVVPNFLRVLAHSPDALRAFLGLHHVANAGALTPATRERIALALAEGNACDYCVSAHTAIGRKAGLSADEMRANREGRSADAHGAAAVALALALNEHRGAISASELAAARAGGLSDAEVVEVITHVGMNLLTNIVGKASQVEIDFPKVALLSAVAA